MMKMLWGFAILTFTCTLACAPKKSATAAHPAATSVAHFESAAKAQRIAKSWRVNCESASDCPDSVAQLIAVNRKDATICTATLVAPDLMLTNSHCLEDKILTADELCKKTRFVFADESPSGYDSVACKDVVLKSDLVAKDFNHPDYMILRLDRAPKRHSSPISRAGLHQRERFAIHKIDPNDDANGGTLTTDHCKALLATAFLPSSSTPQDDVVVTRDCDIRDGNSGSPLMNAQAEITAIAFASVDPDDAESKITGHMARVTNLSCLDLPAPLLPTPASCKTRAPQTGPQSSAAHLDAQARWAALSAAVKAAYPKHARLVDKKLGYHMAVSQDRAAVFYEAFCFNSPGSWLAQYKTGLNYSASADVQPPLMKWTVSWSVDDDLRAMPQLTEAAAPAVHVASFSPATLAATGSSPVTDQATGLTTNWSACPPQK